MIKGPSRLNLILQAREERAERQALLLEQFGLPIISATIVSPGPHKNSELISNLFAECNNWIYKFFGDRDMEIVQCDVTYSDAGPDSQFLIQGGSLAQIKRITVAIEDSHALGRLWDIDVIGPGMTVVSRAQFDLPPRKCLLCAENAHECSRGRVHSFHALNERMHAIYADFKSCGRQ
ncbi:citrate lyase holo-[acyl-carrier protein] synthase [Acetobacter sacchari]|uniref:citrate lyase holo-[acyl-carrier protein] synthase n=1 Tax=Acetobacter sacchari TaxID=2661687 RepID=A0ABS3M0H6_9PROT|nr:citrate lyase holo-[acyl-carrier protein] synthase [Acetobacter sacchari]MBO1361678.1 citrate lyase holo-[acyl-carrier protein] synthase [Acetobacter sacchari]